jgi:pyruvate dehydrogenase E1 component beta subunit
MLHPSLQASETLKEKISIEVIDLRTLSPIDTSTIVKSVQKTGRAVIVHEAPRTAGLAGEITAIINEKAFLSLEAPIERVTGFDVPVPLYKLENYYLPNAQRIAKTIEKVANF